MKTIKQVKQIFRSGGALMVDDLQDNKEAGHYIYRLLRLKVIEEAGNDNYYSIYRLK